MILQGLLPKNRPAGKDGRSEKRSDTLERPISRRCAGGSLGFDISIYQGMVQGIHCNGQN